MQTDFKNHIWWRVLVVCYTSGLLIGFYAISKIIVDIGGNQSTGDYLGLTGVGLMIIIIIMEVARRAMIYIITGEKFFNIKALRTEEVFFALGVIFFISGLVLSILKVT